MMYKLRTECTHDVLHFASGDYYIFCEICGAKWCAHSNNAPEYGYDADGKLIGADSSVCMSPGNQLSGQRRYALKVEK